MTGFDWNAMYLICFGVGLILSLVSFLGEALHLHVGRFHLHAHTGKGGLRGHATSNATSNAGISPLNGFTLMAFLCWFGGTGYLMRQSNVFGAALVLLFSAVSGVAGASLVFWFLVRVLLPRGRTLEPEDTAIVGVTGRLSGGIRAGGVGELLYSQNGARRSIAVRAENGSAMAKDTEVIVMRFASGVAYVRRWEEFEDGLLQEAVDRQE